LSEALNAAAELYDAAAHELERAARHCRTAATHFRNREVPCAAPPAHAWAAHGHLLEAQEGLRAQAREHAKRSVAES
jgi:hypothetical protein